MRAAKQMYRWGITSVMVIALSAVFALTRVDSETSGVRHRVDIQRLQFSPADLLVAPGDTVVWVNLDIVPHTITAKDESWDSQTLQTNDTWALHITKEMTRDYFCRFHPMMVGHVKVKLD